MPGPWKNVVVVGGSFVGLSTAKELAEPGVLPEGHRVIVVEKHSHFHHLFAWPRFAIAPGHEHKGFIPFSHTFPADSPHRVVQAHVLSLVSPTTLHLDRPISLDGEPAVDLLEAEAVVIATGTRLSPPGTVPHDEKRPGVDYFRGLQAKVAAADRIAILGGGAVGVQMACDARVLYPTKEVTVIHSRDQLMPRFHPLLSDTIKARFAELGVRTVLGSRAVVPRDGFDGQAEVATEDGRRVATDLVILATGQTPNSGLLAGLAPSAISQSGFIEVHPTLRVRASAGEETGLLFAVGDIANSGAAKAARPGGAQAKVVAANLRALLTKSGAPLETLQVDPAAIHITLGIKESVVIRNPPRDESGAYVGEPTLFWKDPTGTTDMGIEGVWGRRAPGLAPADYHL